MRTEVVQTLKKPSIEPTVGCAVIPIYCMYMNNNTVDGATLFIADHPSANIKNDDETKR